MGTQSQAFNASSFTILSKAKKAQLSEIPELIKRPVDARALSSLWLDDDFFNLCPVTEALLSALYKPRSVLSKLVIHQLLRLFFLKFDQIDNLELLIKYLQIELERNSNSLSNSHIAQLIKNRKIIISQSGPNRIVKEAIKRKYDLDIFVNKLGLKSYVDTQFYEICQNHYYLEQLQTIKPGVKYPLLQEIIKPSVYESPFKRTKMLGHEILRILIDRSPKNKVDKRWQDIILTIAGDPRISKSNPQYQRWWTALNNQQIQKVRGWLSRVDLLLFLKVLEDYGHTHGKTDMNRMFPARKKFLEGLFDMGLVEDSRLFINHNAESYLKNNYEESELPSYANVKDSTGRSMIYLRIAGKHVVEGTHNFKFWLHDELPADNKLHNYDQTIFTSKELTTELTNIKTLKGLSNSHGTNANFYPHFSISHNGDWQHKVIDAFKEFGVTINPEKVLDEKNYKRRYGVNGNI